MADVGEVIENQHEKVGDLTYLKGQAYGYDGTDPQKLSVETDGSVKLG